MAQVNFAIALDNQGKPKAAIAEWREAIRVQPDDAEAHFGLGLALQQLGKLQAAVAAHRKAIRLLPDLASSHTNLGCALRDQGKLEKAIASSRVAIRLQPDHAAAHYDLAWCLGLFSDLSRRDPAEALVLAGRGVVLAPWKGNSYRALALDEYRLGHWTESLAAIEQPIALKRGGAAYEWFILALALRARGDMDVGRNWFDKAVTWTRLKSFKNIELRQLWSEAGELLGQTGLETLVAGSPAAAGPP